MPVWKRALDLAVCLAVLPILAVCTLLMTVLVRLFSPGPVFFRQERVGYLGRRFRIYKFRTMHVNADTGVHRAHLTQLIGSNVPMTKMDARGDSRLIPGGWLLRASGLDELPQILNVLLGEMSLIGPRPCIPYEYDQYLPWQRKRFLAVPGLTGLWQVSGKNRTTFDEMVRLDIEYAEEKSIFLDLRIILRTVPTLFGQIAETRRRRAAQPAPLAPLPGHELPGAFRGSSPRPSKSPFYSRKIS
ncbi:MAG: sugar transferase [Opitutaceae bacterium]